MKIPTLRDLNLKNQRVLMRVDFNVPLNDDGSILDDSRIRAALPSIQYVIQQRASLILMSHLGRPKGKKDPKSSLAPCAQRLSELLHKPVPLAPDCVGKEVERIVHEMTPGSLLMLENVRFHIGEEEPDKEPGFVEALAKLGTLYINDAFGTAHRAHASTATIARFFPHKAAMGFLMEKEVKELSSLLHSPQRPYFALIGGAKVSSKAGVIKQLLERLDALFIGGAMAYPFFKAKNLSVGASLCDDADIPLAKELLRSQKLHLPTDTLATKDGEIKTFSSGIPEGWEGMDIGPNTVREWKKIFSSAKTFFWNGPVGVYEKPPFDQGTKQIAEFLAGCGAKVVVGGGDSLAAIERFGLQDRFAHLSTGGGASLEFLEFGHLPGIDAL